MNQTQAQKALELSLDQCLYLASNKSSEIRRIDVEHEIAKLRWLNFKVDLKPKWNINGTIPDFSRTFAPTIQPDGTTAFNAVLLSNSNLISEIGQNIPSTGGELFVQSRLRRFDDFNKDNTVYNGNPVIIGLRQPLFGNNSLRWEKKVQIATLRESHKLYNTRVEELNLDVVNQYFEVWQLQIKRLILDRSVMTRRKVYLTVRDKYLSGKVLELELIQADIEQINAALQLQEADLMLKENTVKLSRLIGDSSGLARYKLATPEIDTTVSIDEDVALYQIMENSGKAATWERQMVELQRGVAQAKRNSGMNIEMTATFGLANSSTSLEQLFQDPDDQQTFRLSFRLPVWQWNKHKRAVKISALNKEIALLNIEEERQVFEQQVRAEIRKFKQQIMRIRAVNLKRQLSTKAHNIALVSYSNGKIGSFELNQAWENLQNAHNDYIRTNQDYWKHYFQLRAFGLNIDQ